MLNFLFMFIVFMAGIGMSIQAAINNQLAQASGGNTVLAAAVSFIAGSVLLIVVAVANGGLAASIATFPQQPMWRFCGGFLGAIAVFSMVFFMPKLSLANVLALMIAGQLLAALAIDHFGWIGSLVHKVSIVKLIGVGIMFSGISVILFGDRWLTIIKSSQS